MSKATSIRPANSAIALVEPPASARIGASRSAVTVAAGWGLVITLAQIALAVVLAGGRTRIEGYYHLFDADSGWYQNIVDYGYFSPPVLTAEHRGNVAFFPGYPLFVRCVKGILALETRTAALLASQLAAWAFWTYLLLFFHRWQASARLRVLGVLLVATHPAAFFLVAAYSESLFLTGMLGFLYWTSSPRRGAFVLAAAHGLVMTATRLVGLPLVVFPLLLVLLRAEPAARARAWPWLRALSLGVIASSGAFLFFAYCAWRFGAWDQYARTGHVGWGITPDYSGLFSHRIFHVHWPSLREVPIDPDFVSRLAVPAALVMFVVAAVVEWLLARRVNDSTWRFRLGLYACAFFLLYIPVSAQCTRGMTSMTRYALCVQSVLSLAAVHFLTRVDLDERWSRRLAWACGAWCALCFTLQVMLAWRFVHGTWVA